MNRKTAAHITSIMHDIRPFGICTVSKDSVGEELTLTGCAGITFAESADAALRRFRKLYIRSYSDRIDLLEGDSRIVALPAYHDAVKALLAADTEGPMSVTAAIGLYARVESELTADNVARRMRSRKRTASKRVKVAGPEAAGVAPVVAAAPAIPEFASDAEARTFRALIDGRMNEADARRLAKQAPVQAAYAPETAPAAVKVAPTPAAPVSPTVKVTAADADISEQRIPSSTDPGYGTNENAVRRVKRDPFTVRVSHKAVELIPVVKPGVNDVTTVAAQLEEKAAAKDDALFAQAKRSEVAASGDADLISWFNQRADKPITATEIVREVRKANTAGAKAAKAARAAEAAATATDRVVAAVAADTAGATAARKSRKTAVQVATGRRKKAARA